MSGEIVKIEDYERVLELLPDQFRDSVNLRALFEIRAAQAQDLEDAMFEVRDNYWLDTATGVQLDVIGDILNRPRDGRTDEEYRTYLKNIGTSILSGTPGEIITALQVIYGLEGPIIYSPEYPAGYFIYDEFGYGISTDVLEPITPAGVQGFFGSPIAQGDLSEDEPWMIDATGEPICCAQQVETISLITEDGDGIVTESGEELGGTDLL